jgi:adenylate cyclase
METIKPILKGAYIVVVDDEPSVLIRMLRLLNRSGAEAKGFSDGTEFLNFFLNGAARRPDLVLLDIQLPGKNGCEVLVDALVSNQFPTTVFASFTGYLGEPDFKWLEHIGFDGHVEKDYIGFDAPNKRTGRLNQVESLLTKRKALLTQRDPYRNLSAAVRELSRLRLRTAILINDYITKLVSPDVFAILDSDPTKLSPTLRSITVGFVDIRHFVQLMNRSEMGLIDETLKIFFDFACECILEGNGSVDKFIGDAVMWFHQSSDPNQAAQDCLKVAIKIIQGIPTLRGQIKSQLHFSLPLEVGIGAASGTCAVGIFGSPQYRIQYSVIGPAVNLASRLCSEAKAGQILIGGGIIEHCDWSTRKVGFKQIKGFDHEVEVRSLMIPLRKPNDSVKGPRTK